MELHQFTGQKVCGKDVLESLESELDYYRKQVVWTYTSAIFVEIVLLLSIYNPTPIKYGEWTIPLILSKSFRITLFVLTFILTSFVCLS